MRLGFTGTQWGMTADQKKAVEELVVRLKPTEVHHGDCIGADMHFHQIVDRNRSIKIHIHPPENPSKRAYCAGHVVLDPGPYLERNRDIVDSSTHLIATPKEYQNAVRSGTWYTVRYASKTKKPVTIVFPNGALKELRSIT